MEDKKLNFNQPFLSVRRNSSNVTSQRSNETKTKSNNSHSVVVIPQQLPSHRSELKSGPIRNPGAVPFLWEQKPGQPKQDTKPKTRINSSSDKPPVAPKLPPGRNPHPNPNPNQQHDHCDTYKDNNRQDVWVETSSCVENIEREEEKESCDSEDSDGAYVDALETLSRTESYFLNCSMSGLSGLDDLDIIKPSDRFSTDPKAREFMMDRFLPAAKAMTSETPQYASKAQNISQQQQQQLKKTVNDQYKPSLRYGPSFAKRYSHYNDSEKEEGEEEEESDDDDYDQHANSLGVCGLIPRFCLKGSFGLLNHHVPAISVRTRLPISSCNKVQGRSSSSAGSYSQTEIKSRCNYRSELQSVDKIEEAALNEEEKTKLRNDDDSGELEIEGAGLHGKCGVTTFEELLADQGSPPKESNSGCPVIEKTVYVDRMQIVESPNFSRNYCQLPIPPPLPKSPSDSWLWRTLPSMSAKNSSVSLYIGAATKPPNEVSEDRSTASNMKWETIVKTTKMPRHDHLRYSRESLTAIPET